MTERELLSAIRELGDVSKVTAMQHLNPYINLCVERTKGRSYITVTSMIMEDYEELFESIRENVREM